MILAFLLVSLLLVGCSKEEKYGAGVNPQATVITVEDAFLKSEFLEKEAPITIAGNIQTQCTSNGCWFILRDATGQIFVDLARNNFTVPARGGREVTASGTLTVFNNNLLLVASGVAVK
ncbi:DNA-binding protein [Chrysiogenes arsenatis]|uniref:DNA-binding protein n=1 Tax=Chrysiogenes arsenatis TaxID=309797 RepID=UPI0005534AD7|nr:DNA-binding protein [Chrysiogenes arsenatis]